MPVTQNIESSDRFDSHLDSTLFQARPSRRNTTLYLIVKVFMVRYQPPASNTLIPDPVDPNNYPSFYVNPWDDMMWEVYKNNLVTATEYAWNDKLWLIPNQEWGISSGTNFIPNVRCGLKIQLVPIRHGAHLTVIAYNNTSSDFRSYTGVNIGHFGSDLGNSLSLSRTQRSLRQIPAPHEMAHHLGLGHIDEDYCTVLQLDTDSGVCYGRNRRRQRSIRGLGMEIWAQDAEPWINRIRLHLDAQHSQVEWQATTHRRRPRHI
jgi:hypothetical protein